MFWLPDDKGFYSSFRWYEFAKTINGKVSRRPDLINEDAVLSYACNRQTGVYASIFAYNKSTLEGAQSLAPLYFDLDSTDLALVQQETICLVDKLLESIPESAINIYFSGGKGYHLEIEPICLGITPRKDLPQLFRFIGTALTQELHLTTVDSVVWEQRRMWRLAGSRHEKTGLYKTVLSREQLELSPAAIKDYAKEPHGDGQLPQKFNPKANEWYRSWDYAKTESEQKLSISIEERIKRFQEHGSTIIKSYEDVELVFNPLVFEQCHALGDLWKKSETERELSHYERLFLLSILSYNDEALEYLRTILKQCDDYNEGVTEAHIQDWIKRRELGIGGKPFTCQTANGYSVGCMDCDLPEQEKLERIGNKLISTGEMAPPSPYRFAYERKYKHGKDK